MTKRLKYTLRAPLTDSGTISTAGTVTTVSVNYAYVSFVVPGTPRPQGSMRAFRKRGKTIVTSDNRKLKPWRKQVAEYAMIAMHSHGKTCMQGPVDVLLKFYFARPKSVSVMKRPVMTVKPDIDKLIRSVCDSMTGVVYRDDAQVVKVTALKQYTLDLECVEVWVQGALP